MKLIYTIALFLLTQSIIGNTFLSKWSTEADVWFLKNKCWKVENARGAVFSADGRKIAYSIRNKIKVVRIRDQKVVRIFDFSLIANGKWTAPEHISFSGNGAYLAVSFVGKKEIIIFDYKSGRQVSTLKIGFLPATMRFSYSSAFLLIAQKVDCDAWGAIFNIKANRFFYEKNIPIAGDFSRDDQYFYGYISNRNNRSFVILQTATRRVFFKTDPSKLHIGGKIFTVKVLRNHSVALGTSNALYIVSRFLKEVKKRYYPGEISVKKIIPSYDNKYLIVGDGRNRFLIRRYSGLSKKLALPPFVSRLTIYTAGNYLLYLNKLHGFAEMVKLNPYRN